MPGGFIKWLWGSETIWVGRRTVKNESCTYCIGCNNDNLLPIGNCLREQKLGQLHNSIRFAGYSGPRFSSDDSKPERVEASPSRLKQTNKERSDTDPLRVVADQTLTVVLYATLCVCPKAMRFFLSNFLVRMGVIFLTIWPPTEPASREVRWPL